MVKCKIHKKEKYRPLKNAIHLKKKKLSAAG